MKPASYPTDPAHLWEHFYRFTQIPRPSGLEQAVRDYVIEQAVASGCEHRVDAIGNVVVYVPASAGRESRPTVVIQNHLDMVTVKSAASAHNFERDPLVLQVADGWVSATQTTLGADNGVGCSAALALMTDAGVEHPPLELLFTVDEETGLGGALNLDAGMLSGELMLNLDTEDWHELYVGCAGGAGMEYRGEFAVAAPDPALRGFELRIGGLCGGHSGIQIHEQLGNAIKLLGEALADVSGLQLAAWDAGLAHNVIPREGAVRFACDAAAGEALAARLDGLRESWLAYLPAADAQLSLELSPATLEAVISATDSRRLLDLVAATPHGAQAYNLALPAELVDLSVNLARCTLRDGELYVETSYRFFDAGQAVPLLHTLQALGRSFGLAMTEDPGYPGWKPDFDSALLERAAALHAKLFGERPAVKAIHAGLECGILKGKKPDLDILSFGPTIRGAHSPTERLCIETVAPFWRFLTALLNDI
ncbi:aminoacyl-histidine dipeptidase [Mangrovimicrobium sediminis]|uniref:Cytosol non-specific dipeptidase n=1 Tax=Mangrovimicrobium sediminis TaxID=2562682 RepID=A0A4Z0M3C7_9GAMM|nr:beta-Ala-His dipeptidase [Haliea sp. SAOS-164]TGD73868.1 aminoacyl-histidine dipeptidase [Haliea sp. SAOS-164]